MYSKYASKIEGEGALKQYHHISLDSEFRNDCAMWGKFLLHQEEVCRPFIDFDKNSIHAETLGFYTDASKDKELGFGCYFDKEWTYGQCETNFVEEMNPSIAYLELFALCIGIFTWEKKLQNIRISIFCDNQSVVAMVNSNTSKCKNCMYLLRLLTLNNMIFNRKVNVIYIPTKDNYLADDLSRLRINRFLRRAPKGTKTTPELLPDKLWPLSRIWQQ